MTLAVAGLVHRPPPRSALRGAAVGARRSAPPATRLVTPSGKATEASRRRAGTTSAPVLADHARPAAQPPASPSDQATPSTSASGDVDRTFLVPVDPVTDQRNDRAGPFNRVREPANRRDRQTPAASRG